jgi:hypothetical protein
MEETGGYSEGARRISIELDRCPCWGDFASGEVELREGITRLYRQLATYPTETIREGVELELVSHKGELPGETGAALKVFAFLRVVFDVPPKGVASDARCAIGSMGNPVRNGVLDLLWPYSIDRDGKMSLTGVAVGVTSGRIPNELAAFDALAAQFPRRRL